MAERGIAWCEACGKKTICKGSGAIGVSGAFCADCGGQVECPHPKVLRRDYIGADYEPGQCAWCGAKGLP